MTSKTTVIFASVIALAVSVAGVNSAYAVSPPIDDYDQYYEYQHYQWMAQNYKDMLFEASLIESAWKVGIISDEAYFWSLMDLFYAERNISQEFGDYNWEINNDSTDYIQDIIKNPIAEKKIEALVASK